MSSLWGDEFSITKSAEQTKKIVKKASTPKEVKQGTVKKSVSKKLNIEDRLKLINDNVKTVLGKQIENVVVIKTREELTKYIDEAIKNGRIDIDTETNNSLDPITCKLMGPCIYTPNQKQAYIPINHINYITGERLSWQLTEKDIEEEFNRLKDTMIIMHNGKFDYEVIKCTCNVSLHIDWDTMIAAKLIDENEKSAGLKQQYIEKIDPEQEKYSIDHLFENVEYAWVDPDIFALYAATDAYMTDRLYEWQEKVLTKNENERVFKLFKTLEMPLVVVTAEQELAGVELDKYYSPKLSIKYHKILDDIDQKVIEELNHLKPQIDAFKLSKEGNEIVNGKKSKVEQLEDPINISSPTQLAILLYDILKVSPKDKKKPRGTGEDILEQIKLPICDLILEKRGILKLINTYIDKLPEVVNPKTGRIHCHFNQCGTDTGRFSSSDPNLQNIPSHNKEIRLMFKAKTEYKDIDELSKNIFKVNKNEDIKMYDNNVNIGTLNEGWKSIDELNIGDIVVLSDDNDNDVYKEVINKEYDHDDVYITVSDEDVM